MLPEGNVCHESDVPASNIYFSIPFILEHQLALLERPSLHWSRPRGVPRTGMSPTYQEMLP
jgi:hypothetical protein